MTNNQKVLNMEKIIINLIKMQFYHQIHAIAVAIIIIKKNSLTIRKPSFQGTTEIKNKEKLIIKNGLHLQLLIQLQNKLKLSKIKIIYFSKKIKIPPQ